MYLIKQSHASVFSSNHKLIPNGGDERQRETRAGRGRGRETEGDKTERQRERVCVCVVVVCVCVLLLLLESIKNVYVTIARKLPRIHK